MKTSSLILTLSATLLLSPLASAAQSGTLQLFSNSDYCQLLGKGQSRAQQKLLQVYAAKLGYAPTLRECRLLKQQASAPKDFSLDNALSRLQDGSVRKLPAATVEKLKQADRITQQRLLQQIAG